MSYSFAEAGIDVSPLLLSAVLAAEPAAESSADAPAGPEELPAASPLLPEPHLYAVAGVGLPALAHAEIGVLVHPRVAVEARGSWVVFNPVVGLAVEGAVWSSSGGARGHVITATMEGMVNPTLGPIRLASGGDTLGAYVGVYAGWRWIVESGFLARAQAGALLYDDGGFAAGPNVTVGVGWAF